MHMPTTKDVHDHIISSVDLSIVPEVLQASKWPVLQPHFRQRGWGRIWAVRSQEPG